MTFLEAINLVSNSMNVKQDNLKDISLVKNYINEAYLLLCSKDKRLTTAYIPIVNGIATIPNNSLGILRTIPPLDKKDSIYGNSIVTNKTGVLEAMYFYARENLIEDDEEFDIHEVLQKAVVNYACSLLAVKQDDPSQATDYYNAYYRNVEQYEQLDIATMETIVEVDY